MATSISAAVWQAERVGRATEPSGPAELDGTPLEPAAARREAEARCVVCMARHLLAASNGREDDAARRVGQLLETECPTCLARPVGGG